MGDAVVPERQGGRHAAAQQQTGIPAMPVISPSEQDPGGPYPLIDGLSPTVGWHFRPRAKGGPAFVIMRRTGLGSLKVVESFSLTEDGWASAWRLRRPGFEQVIRGALQRGACQDNGGRRGA